MTSAQIAFTPILRDGESNQFNKCKIATERTVLNKRVQCAAYRAVALLCGLGLLTGVAVGAALLYKAGGLSFSNTEIVIGSVGTALGLYLTLKGIFKFKHQKIAALKHKIAAHLLTLRSVKNPEKENKLFGLICKMNMLICSSSKQVKEDNTRLLEQFKVSDDVNHVIRTEIYRLERLYHELNATEDFLTQKEYAAKENSILPARTYVNDNEFAMWNRRAKVITYRTILFILGAGLLAAVATGTALLYKANGLSFSNTEMGLGATGASIGLILLGLSFFKKTKYQKFAALKLELNQHCLKKNKTSTISIPKKMTETELAAKVEQQPFFILIRAMRKLIMADTIDDEMFTLRKKIHNGEKLAVRRDEVENDEIQKIIKAEILELEQAYAEADPISYGLMRKEYDSAVGEGDCFADIPTIGPATIGQRTPTYNDISEAQANEESCYEEL
jgi:hypothetical protein